MSVDAQRGQRLRSERERLGWSQQQVAAALDIRREMWAKYEAGAEPGASVLGRAASAGIDVLFVLTGKQGLVSNTPLLEEEKALLEGFRVLDERGQAAVQAVIATMSKPGPSSMGRTKQASQQQSIGVHVTQHAHGNDTTQVGSVKNLRIVRKSK